MGKLLRALLLRVTGRGEREREREERRVAKRVVFGGSVGGR